MGFAVCVAIATIAALITQAQAHTPLTRSHYRAVTVLHAPCNTLAFTFANFAGNLGSGWPITVFHNDALSAFVKNTQGVHHMLRENRLHLVSLERHGFDTLPLSSTDGYSKLLTSPSFWRFVNADHVLTFQTDSVLCSLSPWTVHDFLQYDYVGAPWQVSYEGVDIGNGGLSLRKVSTMLHITRTFAYNGSEHEDVYFSRALKKMQDAGKRVNLPSAAVASNFAYEIGLPPLLTSFGVHKLDTIGWRQLTPTWRKATGDTRSTGHAKAVSPHVATVASTCPEAIVGVLQSCRVRRFDGSNEVGVFMAGSADAEK